MIKIEIYEMKLEGVLDLAENVADGGSEQCQNGDNHDCDQHQDQRILHQALAFFTRHIQHVRFTSFVRDCFRAITV